MKRFSIALLVVLLLFGCAHQGLEQTGAWTPASPAAGIQARYLDDAVRENNTAIDAVFGDMLDAGTAVTASAAEVNSTCDGNTATAAELSELHSQGAVAADFAKLHAISRSAVDINNLVTLDGTENLSGKTFTDGLAITGGDLTIRPASGVAARINGGTTAETITGIYAGGYTSTNSTALITVRSKDDATYPGTISLFGTNGTAGAEGLRVKTDGTVNHPVGLEIGGVAVSAPLYTSVSAGGDFTGDVYLAKNNRIVVMTLGGLIHSSDSSPASGAGVIPSAYRPIADTTIIHRMSIAGISMITITTAGSFSMTYYDWTGTLVLSSNLGARGSVSWVSAS